MNKKGLADNRKKTQTTRIRMAGWQEQEEPTYNKKRAG
jgi:hypothetical protein